MTKLSWQRTEHGARVFRGADTLCYWVRATPGLDGKPRYRGFFGVRTEVFASSQEAEKWCEKHASG